MCAPEVPPVQARHVDLTGGCSRGLIALTALALACPFSILWDALWLRTGVIRSFSSLVGSSNVFALPVPALACGPRVPKDALLLSMVFPVEATFRDQVMLSRFLNEIMPFLAA